MSIPVALGELAKALQEYDFAYLLSAGIAGGPHVVAVRPDLVGDAFEVATTGSRTRGNLAEHPDVTLVWPPSDRVGYSLIVDGTATVTGEGVRVVARRAVLHRPAPRPADAAPSATGCVSDCVELPLPAQPSGAGAG